MARAAMTEEKRFWIALAAFALLAVAAWFTLSAETLRVIYGPDGGPLLEISVRGVVLALLGLFAFRSWIHHRRERLEERGRPQGR